MNGVSDNWQSAYEASGGRHVELVEFGLICNHRPAQITAQLEMALRAHRSISLKLAVPRNCGSPYRVFHSLSDLDHQPFDEVWEVDDLPHFRPTKELFP